MNRRDFLKVLRDAAAAVSTLAIVDYAKPQSLAEDNAYLIGTVDPGVWVNASESNRKWRIGGTVYPTHGTVYVTQGTAEMWKLVTREFYIP